MGEVVEISCDNLDRDFWDIDFSSPYIAYRHTIHNRLWSQDVVYHGALSGEDNAAGITHLVHVVLRRNIFGYVHTNSGHIAGSWANPVSISLGISN